MKNIYLCPICKKELSSETNKLFKNLELVTSVSDKKEEEQFYFERIICSKIHAEIVEYCYYCDKRRIDFLKANN